MRDLRIHTGALELQVREYEHLGSPIIFLHYGGANLRMWQRAVPYFKGKYRLILVDLRDHGKSDKPQAGDDLDQMAADVAGMMKTLQLEKAHLVGSSLGAEVALALAANFPEKVLFENYYPRVQCPLLMVTGSENEPAESSAMQKMFALTHQGKLVLVPGWEHPYGWLLHPEAMCQTVLEFLSQVDAFHPCLADDFIRFVGTNQETGNLRPAAQDVGGGRIARYWA